MNDTNFDAAQYAARLAAFATRNAATLNTLVAQLNAAKGKLKGSFVLARRAGACQPDALVTIKYTEDDGTAEGYTHCVNYDEKSVYGVDAATTPSILMVSRGSRGKSYSEMRCEGGKLKAEDVKRIVAMVRSKRTSYLKNIAASVAYAEGEFYRPSTLSMESVQHFKKILAKMG